MDWWKNSSLYPHRFTSSDMAESLLLWRPQRCDSGHWSGVKAIPIWSSRMTLTACWNEWAEHVGKGSCRRICTGTRLSETLDHTDPSQMPGNQSNGRVVFLSELMHESCTTWGYLWSNMDLWPCSLTVPEWRRDNSSTPFFFCSSAFTSTGLFKLRNVVTCPRGVLVSLILMAAYGDAPTGKCKSVSFKFFPSVSACVAPWLTSFPTLLGFQEVQVWHTDGVCVQLSPAVSWSGRLHYHT